MLAIHFDNFFFVKIHLLLAKYMGRGVGRRYVRGALCHLPHQSMAELQSTEDTHRIILHFATKPMILFVSRVDIKLFLLIPNKGGETVFYII